MAFHRVFAIFVVIAAIVPMFTFAKEFIVGDGTGWTIGFNYQSWAAGKNFLVGDTLVFQYPVGVHNVYKVNGTDFQTCNVPLQAVPLTSGNDTIVLATPGKKWYLCGVGQHCASGQKLAITVQAPFPTIVLPPSVAPSPAFAMTYESRKSKRSFFNFHW